jgi:methylenetetrahydrofolate reductase (NADPH)
MAMVTSPARDEDPSEDALHAGVADLARHASIEINVPDLKHLDASRSVLPPGKRIYVNHLPKQSWSDTIAASRAVHAAQFDPVPHIPVRLLTDVAEADRLLAALKEQAAVAEVLLISGDYERARGPFSAAINLLRTGLLSRHGLTRVSFAGHPEGHPRVALEEIRRAEIEKAQWAEEAGMSATILTQFFFESAPFIEWAGELRRHGVRSTIVAGVAGPASIAKLVRFAVRCGVGRSLRAFSARPDVMTKLLDEHGPETLVSELVAARDNGTAPFDGVHVFGFGGYLRTCQWLQRVTAGEFTLEQ